MITRRELLKRTGSTGTALLFAHAFGGCGGKATSGNTTPPPPLPQDPMGRWWLSNNYAPVPDEIEAFDLEVEGSLPPELNGLYVRNGSNPKNAGSAHWFTGDGMLHGIRFGGGSALWYRNRWVDTLALQSGMEDSIIANRANTSIKGHAGKLLALYEVAVPHEISTEDLSTVGEYDFAGELRRPMTAHPKIDPVTGEMFFIGYAPFPPYLTYHVVDAQGALVRSIEIDVPHSSMMHDFQITESHALIYDLPIHFDLEALDSGFPFRWVPEAGARIGVLARDGSSSDVQWFEIDTCYMFHTFNAYETGGRIALEGCRLESLWAETNNDVSESPKPWRWELDPATGNASEDRLHDGAGDFPQIDARMAGRQNQIAYSLRFPEMSADEIAAPFGIAKHDRRTGVTDVWDAKNGQPDEALFVPAGAGEDEGYLVSFVFDKSTHKSYVAVLDATNVSAGPIARVHLPRRVPFGFHGTWVSGT